MVRQAEDLGRVGLQPLLDALGREAGKFAQPPLALGQFREYLDPAIGDRAVLKPLSNGRRPILKILEKASNTFA